MKRLVAFLLAIVLLTTGTVYAASHSFWSMGAGDTAKVVCGADELTILTQTTKTLDLVCIAYTPTPTATSVPTLTLTPTRTPNTSGPTRTPTSVPATATAIATDTPLPPTVTPTPQAVAPHADAVACAAHDPTAYHGLWNALGDCHFDHTHFADPTAPEVQAIFGDLTDYTGQEVSYPWQTFAGAAPGYPMPPVDVHYENVFKHNGYKFDFLDLPVSEHGCPTRQAGIKAVANAWLVERHSLGHKPDFMSRVHSVWAMVRFCLPDAPGEVAYLYTGGWQDFGQRTSPYKTYTIPVPGNPDPPYPADRAPYIAHSCFGAPECANVNIADLSWISLQQIDVGGHRLFAFGFRSNDSQQKLDATLGFNQPDPKFVYLCADEEGNYVAEGCHFNHSTGFTYQISGEIPESLDLLDGANDDRVNYTGYTDRWGNIKLAGCATASLDCVPVLFENMPIGRYHTNTVDFGIPDDEGNPSIGIPDYDLCTLDGEFVDCLTTEDAVSVGWIGESN